MVQSGICQCETDGEKGIKMEHRTGRKRREWSKIRTAKRPRGPLPESQTGIGTELLDQGMRVMRVVRVMGLMGQWASGPGRCN